MLRDTREVRAAGLQGDPSSEIIEILDDDTDAFGDRATSHTFNDVGGPKWVGPVAALALIGLIGYGVATSSSSGVAPKATPVTSTTGVPQTTQPTPTTTTGPPAPPVPYYAADPPRQYRVQFAENFLEQGGFNGEDYQLRAKPGATATSGSWFSMVSLRGQQSIYAQNAYRLQSDKGSLAISHLPLGQTGVQFSNNRSSSVQLTAFGWTDDDLVRLAESITLGGGEPVFTDPSLIAGYEVISAVEPWLVVQGLPLEQIYYASVDDPYGGVNISVAPLDRLSQAGPTLDRATALKFLLDHATPFTVDGHQAVAGMWVGQSGYGLATWTAGDHIVTVAGTMPVPQLIAIARTVRQVSAREWDGMKFQAAGNSSEGAGNNAAVTPPYMVPVSYGTDTEGVGWTIRVGLAAYGKVRQINWDWTGYRSLQSTVVTTPDNTVQITTFADNDRSYVLADLPRAIAATAELQVSRGGLDPVVAPFNDTDPNADRIFAAYAFSEPGPFTAQVVGPGGIVLATWPSP